MRFGRSAARRLVTIGPTTSVPAPAQRPPCPRPEQPGYAHGPATHKASILPPCRYRPDDFLGAGLVQGIPSRQRGAVRFRRFALAIFARAENPGRSAEVFAEQAPKAFTEAIELRPDEFVNPRRQAIAVSQQRAQLPKLPESESRHPDGLPLRSNQRVPPFRRSRRKGLRQCSCLGHWLSYSRQRGTVMLSVRIILFLLRCKDLCFTFGSPSDSVGDWASTDGNKTLPLNEMPVGS
jgi:hypothetical protein